MISSIPKSSNKDQITLRVAESNTEIAQKLHQSFAHPSADKLLKLLKNAGGQWANKELQDEIKNISENAKSIKSTKNHPHI